MRPPQAHLTQCRAYQPSRASVHLPRSLSAISEREGPAENNRCSLGLMGWSVKSAEGAAYRIRGIYLGVGGKIAPQWSIFGGLVLMQSEVTKSLIPPANALLYTSNVGLPLRTSLTSLSACSASTR